MRRDMQLGGWICQRHGRITFDRTPRGELLAARHLRDLHPALWAADVERVR